MKKIEIFSIGTELINYSKTDTNSVWLINKLNKIGYSVIAKHFLPDDKEIISRFISQELDHADIIITLGGLGPTHDDVSKDAVSNALSKDLIFIEDIWHHIERRYKELGRVPPESAKVQAYIPKESEYFINKYGTAPGLWINHNDKIIIMLPGPPVEFIHLAEESVLPRLEQIKQQCQSFFFATTGLPESQVEELLKPFYEAHPNFNVTLLAMPLQVDIYISVSQSQLNNYYSIDEVSKEIYSILGDYIFTNEEGKALELVIGELLIKNNLKLAVAESCTGGKLADRITNISGSSNYFERGIVTYSNESKIELLGVQPYLIEKFGAVSKEVAIAMAEGIRIRSHTDIGIGITGIAGPTGGTESKPIGTVHIALSSKDYLTHQHSLYKGDRKIIKFASTQTALNMLWRFLINYPQK